MSFPTLANSLEAEILSFEENTLPNWIEGDSINLTKSRAISGKQSLLWEWDKGDEIIFNHHFTRMTDSEATSAYVRKATQVLSFWIYNPAAVDDTMTVKLSDASGSQNSTTEFDVGLNFTGWRSIGVSLNLDFTPAVTSQLEKISFTAPTGTTASSGQLYIDRIMVSVDDYRYQWSDDQITTRIVIPEIDFGLSEDLPDASPAELADSEQIKQALITELKGYTGNMQSLEDRFAVFGITKDINGNISGRHIITDKQQVIYQPDNLSYQDKLDFSEYAILGDSDAHGAKEVGYAKLMLDIAKAYHEPAFSADRARLTEMYLLLTEHLLDQGFVHGSSLVTTHHWGYSARWWYNSALLMEEELISSNLHQPTYNALLWFSREFKESFDMVLTHESSNLDYFNTLSIQHLALILLTPDDNKRVALLHKFSEFFSGALAQTPPGSNDGLRDDGTAWRHNGHYPGYAFSAFENAGIVSNMLKNTAFNINSKGLDKLKQVMLAGWYYSNPVVPLGISGRHPFTTLSVSRYAYGMKMLAKSYPEVDEALASVYLEIIGASAAESQTIFGKTISPAKLPEGSWSFNGGAFAVHRHDERMALIKGYNKDVWSAEIYTNDNRYGRYQSHGSVHIIPHGDPTQMGFKQEGWDWNRNPGATGIYLDYDLLESPRTSTVMVKSEEGISGSTSLNSKFSIFAFKHKAPSNLTNYESSFVAEKFVLAGNDKLYLVGKGISNSDGANHTETTLFQIATGSKPKGIWINGNYHNQNEFQHVLTSGDWLIDNNSVGYYLIDAKSVKLRRGLQESRHNKTKAPTEGKFTTAWIDHGKAPKNDTYQYIVLMNTTPTAMANFVHMMKDNPQFSIAEQTEHGLVLFDKKSNVYGYSNFASGVYEKGPIHSIDTTAQVLSQVHDDRIDLSLSSTELNIQYDDTPTPPVTITVEVSGLWEIPPSEDALFYHRGDKTVIEATSLFGQAVNLHLCKDLSNCDTDDENDSSPPDEIVSEKNGSSTSLITIAALLSILRYRRTRR